MSDETKAPDLLPCPFCGGTNLSQGPEETWVKCGDCMTDGPGAVNGSKLKGRNLWNTRTHDRAALLASPIVQELVREKDAEIERLTSLLEEAAEALAAAAGEIAELENTLSDYRQNDAWPRELSKQIRAAIRTPDTPRSGKED